MAFNVERAATVPPSPSHDGARACDPPAIHCRLSGLSNADPHESPRPPTDVIVVDDCKLHRENLAAALTASGLGKPTLAWDLASLTAALRAPSTAIVLLNMATRDSVPLLRLIRERRPELRVISVGVVEEDEDEILACAEAGVSGYHLRSDSLDDLFVVVQEVLDGGFVCSPKVSAILLRRVSALAAQTRPPALHVALTNREVEILRMLEMGLSNRDIARQLSIAVHTVKNHVHSVLRKLGVRTRQEAAALSRDLRYEAL